MGCTAYLKIRESKGKEEVRHKEMEKFLAVKFSLIEDKAN